MSTRARSPFRSTHQTRRGPSRADGGQATPLVALVLVLAALLLIPTGLVVRAAVDRAEARTAADAAALAGALVDRAEAEAVARDNGARLESYGEVGSIVEVTVIVGDRRATARAVREVELVPPGG